MIDVSIIIPHYNSVNLLEKLLLSIPQKENLQIIVVDDNSTKDLEKLEYMKKREIFSGVVFLQNNTNTKGAGVCRNIGLQYAKGVWVIFADSDDYFVDDFYNVIQRYFKTKYDVIFFTPTSIILDTNEKAERHLQYEKLINKYNREKNLESELQLRYHFTAPWSKMIKLNLIKQKNIKFDEIIAANDVMFSTKIGYYLNSFYASYETIYCITRNKGSLTMNLSEEVFDARLAVHIRYCNFLNKNLERNQLKHLDLIGLRTLVKAHRNKLGMAKVFSSYKTFKRNNIKIIDSRFINPLFVIRKLNRYVSNYRNEKKYYI